NIAHAELIEETLNETSSQFELKHTQRLSEALILLKQENFDVILLDLSLPDSQGLEGMTQLKEQVQTTPLIVLTALDDRNVAIQSLREGAQDYIIKGDLEAQDLIRSIDYAIERHRKEESLRHQAIKDRLRVKMLENIRQSLELKETLQTTVEEVRQFLQVDRVIIYRCGNSNSGEVMAESVELDNNRQSSEVKVSYFPFNSILPQACSIQAIDDVDYQAELNDEVYALAAQEIKAILTFPIWQRKFLQQKNNNSPLSKNPEKFLWGMLIAHNRNLARKWQEWEINLLKDLTEQVTIAIEQSELYTDLQNAYQKLQQQANLDSLTELGNLRQFEETLRYEWQRLMRDGKPLSLLMCDIDYFKAYNDTYGHPTGNQCLKQVAKILKQTVKRPGDTVARYGGEEFAIILPDTKAQGALFIAQTIQSKLEKLAISHINSKINKFVTLSIGISTMIPRQGSKENIIVEAADQALYQAKKQGRNRIVS
ncbi:MAG: diguanylate cyclase, partial [Cyanobacteria bacterium J083]